MAAYEETPQNGGLKGNGSNTHNTNGKPQNSGKRTEYGVNNPLPPDVLEGLGNDELTHVMNGLSLRLDRLGARLLHMDELEQASEQPWRSLYRRGYRNGVAVWFDVTFVKPSDWPAFIAELRAVCL